MIIMFILTLMKNFELNREINKNKVKEQEKRKNPTIKKIGIEVKLSNYFNNNI